MSRISRTHALDYASFKPDACDDADDQSLEASSILLLTQLSLSFHRRRLDYTNPPERRELTIARVPSENISIFATPDLIAATMGLYQALLPILLSRLPSQPLLRRP